MRNNHNMARRPCRMRDGSPSCQASMYDAALTAGISPSRMAAGWIGADEVLEITMPDCGDDPRPWAHGLRWS